MYREILFIGSVLFVYRSVSMSLLSPLGTTRIPLEASQRPSETVRTDSSIVSDYSVTLIILTTFDIIVSYHPQTRHPFLCEFSYTVVARVEFLMTCNRQKDNCLCGDSTGRERSVIILFEGSPVSEPCFYFCIAFGGSGPVPFQCAQQDCGGMPDDPFHCCKADAGSMS